MHDGVATMSKRGDEGAHDVVMDDGAPEVEGDRIQAPRRRACPRRAGTFVTANSRRATPAAQAVICSFASLGDDHYCRRMTRIAAHPIEPFILNRWSPRAMNGSPVPREQLDQLFEAARWAPSWGNSQPWRFVLAVRDTPAFKELYETLAAGNQEWCVRAAALVLMCSTTISKHPDKPDRPLPTHAFDTGAAWMALALQGRAMNLVVHAMGGFDPARARQACKVPDDVAIHCVVAIGQPGDVALLSEKNRASEKPNDRDPIDMHVIDGAFG